MSNWFPNQAHSEAAPDEGWPRFSAHGRRFIERIKDFIPNSPRARAIGLTVGLLLFGGGILLSWRRLSPIDLVVWPVLINAALVPLTVGASTWQVRLIARTAGVDPGWWKSFRVTTLGALSGLLPVSSGTLVRGGAVLYWGATAGRMSRALAVDFLLWLAVSLLLGGGAALWLGQELIGWPFLITGAVALPIAQLIKGPEVDRSLWLQLLIARGLGIIVNVPRLAMAFAAVGIAATAAEAAVLTAPGVLASTLFFLPAGLGVKEGMTAFLGTAIGLSAAGAFLAAAINRLIALTMIMVWECGLWLVSNAKRSIHRGSGGQ